MSAWAALLMILALAGLWAYMIAQVGRLHRQVMEEQEAHQRCHEQAENAAYALTNRIVAVALRDYARRWDSVEEQSRLQRLARDQYVPGGPSMPAIWLRTEADRLDPTEATAGVGA